MVAAVKAAGLARALAGPGPFTLFAPTNKAFDKLPAGTVDSLRQPQNKAQLTKVLTYHVIPGKLSGAELAQEIKQGGGRATLQTIEGETLTVRVSGTELEVTDTTGHTARVTIPDVLQKNGVIHVVDTVLLPK